MMQMIKIIIQLMKIVIQKINVVEIIRQLNGKLIENVVANDKNAGKQH